MQSANKQKQFVYQIKHISFKITNKASISFISQFFIRDLNINLCLAYHVSLI